MQLSSPWIDTNSFWHTHTHSNGLKKIWLPICNFLAWWSKEKKAYMCLLTPKINWIKIKLVYSLFLFFQLKGLLVFEIDFYVALYSLSKSHSKSSSSQEKSEFIWLAYLQNGNFTIRDFQMGTLCAWIIEMASHVLNMRTYIYLSKNLQTSCTPVCQRKE